MNKNRKFNADGSLTLYVQSSSPEAYRVDNWLPAPRETFSLYVRCYWPEEVIVNDNWNPPAVIRLND